MSKHTKIKNERPSCVYLKDTLEPEKAHQEFKVEPAYGGILFCGHFCLSKPDAKMLVAYLNEVLK